MGLATLGHDHVFTIGDEISLITFMFRTADDRTPFVVPVLFVVQLSPGLIVTPSIGGLRMHVMPAGY